MVKRKANSSLSLSAELVSTEREENSVEVPAWLNHRIDTDGPTRGSLERVPTNHISTEVDDEDLDLGPFWELLKLAGYEAR